MNCLFENSSTTSTPDGHVSCPGRLARAEVAAVALWKRTRSSGAVALQDDRVSVTSKKYWRNWFAVDETI
jgi:hypothetical protein